MNKENIKNSSIMELPKRQKGQELMITMILSAFFFIILSVVLTLVSNYVYNERYLVASSQALNIAEGGVDYAIDQLNQNSSYAGESDKIFGEGVFSVSVTDIDSSHKNISVTSYVPNSSNPVATKTVKINTDIGTSVIS